jgi:hypothetical protein
MGFGKYIYWILWLPMVIVSVIAMAFFYISWAIGILQQVAKGVHEEIKGM